MKDTSSARPNSARFPKIVKRSALVVAAGVALQCAVLLSASPAFALDSSTIVVGQGDTISALFKRARVPQSQLMALLHSSKKAEKKLDRVRPGAILSVVVDAAGRLQRLQITSKRGKLTTFVRTLDGDTPWQIIDGEVAASVPAVQQVTAVPANDNLARADVVEIDSVKPDVSETNVSTTTTSEPSAPVAPVLDKTFLQVRALIQNELAASHQADTPRVEAEQDTRKDSPRRMSSPAAELVRRAESQVQAARMVAKAVAPVELDYELIGMSAKVHAAEQRVERARARRHLLSFGPKNTRAVMRDAEDRVRRKRGGRKVGKVLASARDLLGSPYVWGGTSPSGFDCSGFVVYNLKKVDVRVPRTAHQQFNHTRNSAVAWNDLQPGDLVFFHDRNNRRRIGHVGIFIGDGKFIHAVKKGIPVKITSMNRAYYRKRFVRGGRVLS